MNKIYIFLTCALLCCTSLSFAAEKKESTFPGASVEESMVGIPAVPYKVILTQHNARVFAQSKLRLLEAHGQKVFELPLPKGASDVKLSLPLVNGKSQGSIRAFSLEPANPFKPMGTLEKLRVTFESKADSLSGSIATLIAQYNAIYDPISKLPPQEAKASMEKVLPDLALLQTRLEAARRELKHVQSRVRLLEDKTPMSQKMVVVVDSPLVHKAVLHVMYSYTLNDSKWTPSYTISANAADNSIDVQLMGKIVQNSDMDWNNTRIELSLAAGNDQAPAPLRPWIISEQNPQMRSRSNAMEMAMPMLAKAEGGVSLQENTALANYVIEKKLTIPEGETFVALHEQRFNLPLERVARPSAYGRQGGQDGRVWLSAKVDLKNAFLPQGQADYFLDGVNVGQGVFTPEGQSANLFFGADTLVSVDIVKNVRKSGQDGIIQKEQTWTWNWTYTVYNQRKMPVKVRIEEPEIQLGNDKMSVTYVDKPKAQKGAAHTLFWDINVPAKGSQKVERSVTVKAPKDMKVFLDR